MKLFVVNETPPTVRQFTRLDFWVGKGSKIRLETLKTLENTGLFRFVVIIPSKLTSANIMDNVLTLPETEAVGCEHDFLPKNMRGNGRLAKRKAQSSGLKALI